MNNLLDKELKALVITMLTKLDKRIDGHNENFNKEAEKIIYIYIKSVRSKE